MASTETNDSDLSGNRTEVGAEKPSSGVDSPFHSQPVFYAVVIVPCAIIVVIVIALVLVIRYRKRRKPEDATGDDATDPLRSSETPTEHAYENVNLNGAAADTTKGGPKRRVTKLFGRSSRGQRSKTSKTSRGSRFRSPIRRLIEKFEDAAKDGNSPHVILDIETKEAKDAPQSETVNGRNNKDSSASSSVEHKPLLHVKDTQTKKPLKSPLCLPDAKRLKERQQGGKDKMGSRGDPDTGVKHAKSTSCLVKDDDYTYIDPKTYVNDRMRVFAEGESLPSFDDGEPIEKDNGYIVMGKGGKRQYRVRTLKRSDDPSSVYQDDGFIYMEPDAYVNERMRKYAAGQNPSVEVEGGPPDTENGYIVMDKKTGRPVRVRTARKKEDGTFIYDYAYAFNCKQRSLSESNLCDADDSEAYQYIEIIP